MAKVIIKEIGILLLLTIAIILVLAIVFYDYIPNNKTVPIQMEAYDIPEDIKIELQKSTEEENIVKTFYIDNADLDSYESSKDYNKGKANPFANYSTNQNDNSSDTSNGNSSNSNNNSNNNNSNDNNNNSTDRNQTSNNNSNDNVDEQEDTDKEVYITTPGKNY